MVERTILADVHGLLAEPSNVLKRSEAVRV
jgi:hypothetical protein